MSVGDLIGHCVSPSVPNSSPPFLEEDAPWLAVLLAEAACLLAAGPTSPFVF